MIWISPTCMAFSAKMKTFGISCRNVSNWIGTRWMAVSAPDFRPIAQLVPIGWLEGIAVWLIGNVCMVE